MMNKNNIFDQIQIFTKYLKWKLYEFDNWPRKEIEINFTFNYSNFKIHTIFEMLKQHQSAQVCSTYLRKSPNHLNSI